MSLGPVVSSPIMLTPTLVLLAWQEVSDSMPGHVPPHYFHSYIGPVCLTVCEWFHASSSSVEPLSLFTLSLLSYCLNSMWVIPCQSAVSLLTILTSTLILLASQVVSESMPGLATSFSPPSLPLWSCWIDRKWVIYTQAYYVLSHLESLPSLPLWLCWLGRLWVIPWPGPAMSLLITIIPPTLILLGWQVVSDKFMSCPVVSLLTALTLTLVLLTWQLVSEFMSGLAVAVLCTPTWSCWLSNTRLWVIPYQVQLCFFSHSPLPCWSYWLDSKWVAPYQVQLCPFSPSSLLLWSYWLDRLWVILCQVHLCLLLPFLHPLAW